MGVAGACRGKELCQLDCNDVSDHKSFFLVNLRGTKSGKDRLFVIKTSGENSTNVVELVRKYIGLRPPTKHTRFFVSYKNGKCMTQPIGKNTFGQLPRRIAGYLRLPNANLYTGHCFRRSSASLLADSGSTIDVLKRHGGWKSSSVAEGYVENSLYQKKNVADQIFTNVFSDVDMASASTIERSISENETTATATATYVQNMFTTKNVASNCPPFVSLANCTKVNINVNIYNNKN